MNDDNDNDLDLSQKGQRRVGKRRMAVAAGLTAGLLGGGVAGLAFTGNLIGAGAQTGSSTTTPSTPSSRPAHPKATDRLNEILKPLVDNGTINQSQADAVIKALEEAGPGRGGHGDHGRPGHPVLREGLDVAAKALDMTPAELRTELRNGTSIKDVAEAKHVNVKVVTDALIKDVATHLAEQVKDGTITGAQYSKRLVAATERINNMVNRTLPPRPEGAPSGD